MSLEVRLSFNDRRTFGIACWNEMVVDVDALR